MTVKTSFSTDGTTAKRLKEMAREDRRMVSNFVTWLINEEWDRRHETSLGETAAAIEAEPVASP